jgi:hypothetical protein
MPTVHLRSTYWSHATRGFPRGLVLLGVSAPSAYELYATMSQAGVQSEGSAARAQAYAHFPDRGDGGDRGSH